jgi:hypothetical protein
MPDALSVSVNLAHPVERNPPRLARFVQHFKHAPLTFRDADLPEGDPLDRAPEPLEKFDLELAGAKLPVVVYTGKQFVDGLHGGCSRSSVSRTFRRKKEAHREKCDTRKPEKRGQHHSPIPLAAQRNHREGEHRQTGNAGERCEERTGEGGEPF